MIDLSITEDDRASLEVFVKTDVYRKMSAYAVERARDNCEAPSDRVQFHQGRVSGIRDFCRLIENFAKPPLQRAATGAEVMEHFRSTVGRKA